MIIILCNMGGWSSRLRVGGDTDTFAKCERYIGLIKTIFNGGRGWERNVREANEIKDSGTGLTGLVYAFIDSGVHQVESLEAYLNSRPKSAEATPQRAAMELAAEWDTALELQQTLKRSLIEKTTAAQDSDKTVNGAFNVQYVRNNRFDRGREEWVAVIYIDGVIKVELFYGFTNQVGVKLYAWAWMGGHPDIGNCFTTAAALMKTMPGRAVNLIELSN